MSAEEELTETDEALNAIDHSIMLMKKLALKTRNIEYDETLNKTKYYGHSNFEEVNIYGKPVALKEDIQNIKTDDVLEHMDDVPEVKGKGMEDATENLSGAVDDVVEGGSKAIPDKARDIAKQVKANNG